MGNGAARRARPGLGIIVALCVAGCTGHQGPAAPMAAVPASGYSNAAATGALNSPTGSRPPGDLTGLDSSALHSLFGTPELVRKDYPAEVWQYRNPSCVLDVYLYPDHDRLTVAHAEARAPKATGDPLAGCIAKFAQARSKTVG